MSLNTAAFQEYAPGKTGSADYYGHADYARDKAAGISDSELLAKINADPSKMGNGGVGGDLYNQISAGANSGGGGGSTDGGSTGGGSTGEMIGAGAGAYNPADVNFNPGGIDMGGDSGPTWSNDDFIAGLAKERSQEYINNGTSTETNTITNDIEQNIGNKGDWETNIGDNNTINNSSIGNDYGLNLGSLNVANRIN